VLVPRSLPLYSNEVTSAENVAAAAGSRHYLSTMPFGGPDLFWGLLRGGSLAFFASQAAPVSLELLHGLLHPFVFLLFKTEHVALLCPRVPHPLQNPWYHGCHGHHDRSHGPFLGLFRGLFHVRVLALGFGLFHDLGLGWVS